MVGRLLKILDDTGMADSTAIVLTSDHGDMLGEHGLWFKKHFLEDCARVPLLIVMPGTAGDSRSFANVSLVDVLPTLCDLAGVDASALSPEPLDGISLVPACNGAATLFDRPVYAEITSESVPAPMFMVRRGRHKLITGGDAPDALFVLDSDPHELVNRAAEPGQAGIHQSLRDLARARWDKASLAEAVTRSQRRRRLVDRAHQDGQRVRWEADIAEPMTPWLLRGEGLYNDWAWRGIDET
jgi:choline-sulfatase